MITNTDRNLAPSYQMLNYSLRPAKQIERRMLADTFQRLSEIQRIESYRYIGFGSIYFADFILFHRILGIKKMISIEREIDDEPRVRFNIPFRCINLKIGDSNSILPTLEWKERTIAWLDYDGPLDQKILTDINFFCTEAVSGSVIVVSVNVEPGETNKESKRIQRIKERVGSEKLPIDIQEKNLSQWGTALVCKQIIANEISEALSTRNGILSQTNQLSYSQIFHFHYRDGARMLTTGGIIFNQQDSNAVRSCSFERLEFCRSNGDEPFLIEVPKLTHREVRHLDAQLPIEDIKAINAPGIPEDHLSSYIRMYRYFPHYAEVEI